VRRTSSIDTQWPEGYGTPTSVAGRARDYVTLEAGKPGIVAGEDWLRIRATPRREILAIEACRSNEAAQGFVGLRGGGHLREGISRLLPEEREGLTPLHLLLDDFSGASLVCNWGWSQWIADWRERMLASGVRNAGRNGKMEGVCSGFRPGSSSLSADGTLSPSGNAVPVMSHPTPDDADGWHAMTLQVGPGMRRMRRLDVRLEGGQVAMDLDFQDSATRPSGGRVAVHEYRVRAAADLASLRLTAIEVVPAILPYGECLDAAPSASHLLGLELATFRTEVLARLRGTVGCTHLNDVLRSLADVPGLIRTLRAAQLADGKTSTGEEET
jgi:hypothetical protein